MTVPYWTSSDGRLVLYNADCRDVLPTLAPESVDAIITDPPYGVDWQSNWRAHSFEKMAGDDGSLDIRAILESACTALRRRRHIYAFGPFDLSRLESIAATAELIWDKGVLGSGDLSSPWAVNHEAIQFGVRKRSRGSALASVGKLSARLRRGSVLQVQRVNGVAVNRHPTEKPVLLLRMLIESSTLIDETVLDPFMGSGSTGEACKREDRRFIGIEIEERYAEIAARRLEDPPMLAALRAEQSDLFAAEATA